MGSLISISYLYLNVNNSYILLIFKITCLSRFNMPFTPCKCSVSTTVCDTEFYTWPPYSVKELDLVLEVTYLWVLCIITVYTSRVNNNFLQFYHIFSKLTPLQNNIQRLFHELKHLSRAFWIWTSFCYTLPSWKPEFFAALKVQIKCRFLQKYNKMGVFWKELFGLPFLPFCSFQLYAL